MQVCVLGGGVRGRGAVHANIKCLSLRELLSPYRSFVFVKHDTWKCQQPYSPAVSSVYRSHTDTVN